jgi:threonine dehydrogenase-like Zn-dependent dehydrogenase
MNIQRCKKIIFAAKKDARIIEEDFSLDPGEDEITGKTLVSVVSSGSETGGYMDYFGGTVYPCDTGYANVAEVKAVGTAVKGLRPGDMVFSQAPHREFIRLKEEDTVVVPAGMTAEHAVLARFPAVSMTTLIKTKIKPTENVVVAGLGIIGLMCAQVMRRCGYPVYCVDPAPLRRSIAEKHGVENTFASFEELAGTGAAFGLCIDCSGNDDATLALVKLVRKGGEVALVGVPWRATSGTVVNELFRMIFTGYVTLYSGWEWSIPKRPLPFLPDSNFKSFALAMDWIHRGEIKVEDIYETRRPEECVEVYREISEGRLGKTCALFDWRI